MWGEGWESKPCNGYPQPPELTYVKSVGVLKKGLELELIQNSDYFSMMDAMDDIIALGWEKDENEIEQRLVFRFGEDEEIIKDKLYERDIILEIQ
mgnify:FL=1